MTVVAVALLALQARTGPSDPDFLSPPPLRPIPGRASLFTNDSFSMVILSPCFVSDYPVVLMRIHDEDSLHRQCVVSRLLSLLFLLRKYRSQGTSQPVVTDSTQEASSNRSNSAETSSTPIIFL
ncbi:hypothetical protein IW261DRAFT_723428 [Armillaria novae-zelandiae]|uniref:Uncharacterized protein n=1 Tax=Armillaria novae-zelandiae TaxID=153914 RepID=A0AA39T950_9AGAR|nr:hypothetical protein IW261DRAFT_723428 [Armillaria novae-zelandiae]